MTDSRPVVYLTRREHFSAAHRLWADQLSAEENEALFGPCAREHGHGHNYYLEVTLRGPVDPRTGVVVNLSELKAVLRELILEDVDQNHLNLSSELLRGINPTAENIALVFWRVLAAQYAELLYEVRVRETEKNWVSYRGELSPSSSE